MLLFVLALMPSVIRFQRCVCGLCWLIVVSIIPSLVVVLPALGIFIQHCGGWLPQKKVCEVGNPFWLLNECTASIGVWLSRSFSQQSHLCVLWKQVCQPLLRPRGRRRLMGVNLKDTRRFQRSMNMIRIGSCIGCSMAMFSTTACHPTRSLTA